MVPHLFYYQLALLALVWLFVMLHVTWPKRGVPVWSKYSSLPSHRKLRLYHRPRVGLSSAPLFPILSVHRDGKA